jgi:hypothetical protein
VAGKLEAGEDVRCAAYGFHRHPTGPKKDMVSWLRLLVEVEEVREITIVGLPCLFKCAIRSVGLLTPF